MSKARTDDFAVEVLAPPSGSLPGVVSIRRGKVACGYWVVPLLADWGFGCRLSKYGGDPGSDGEADAYDVLLDGPDATCHCRGHLRHGTPCKHIRAVRQLLAEGFFGAVADPGAAGPPAPAVPAEVCPACRGSGAMPTVWQEDDPCEACGGTGVLEAIY